MAPRRQQAQLVSPHVCRGVQFNEQFMGESAPLLTHPVLPPPPLQLPASQALPSTVKLTDTTISCVSPRRDPAEEPGARGAAGELACCCHRHLARHLSVSICLPHQGLTAPQPPPTHACSSLPPTCVQIADKIGLPGLYLHEAVEDESVEGTGNLIWTAGVRLSQHLVKNRGGELKGARVLDLGAGTGVCARCCHNKGVVGCRQDHPAASRCSTSFSLLQCRTPACAQHAQATALLSCPLLPLPLPGLSVVPLLAAA